MALSKKCRFVYCADCGCRLEMDGICKICGHADNPLLPGIVPDVTGLLQLAAIQLLSGGEAQLSLGNTTTENSETVSVGLVISSSPVAGTQLAIGDPVDIVVSLGPAI